MTLIYPHFVSILTSGFFILKDVHNLNYNVDLHGFPSGTSDKESACQYRRQKRLGFSPWLGKIPWRRKWQPTPVFLPENFYGQEPGGLQSMGSQRVRHDLATEHTSKQKKWIYVNIIGIIIQHNYKNEFKLCWMMLQIYLKYLQVKFKTYLWVMMENPGNT